MPADLDAALRAIGLEALRIHESAEWSAQGQFEQAKIWRRLNLWLGAPAAIAAALAGSAGLSQTDDSTILGVRTATVAALLALLAAAFSATLTTINASRRMTQAQSSANAYLQLQTEARQFATIDLEHMSYEDARQGLEAITSSRNELNKTADPPGRIAYRRAGRNLNDDGGQSYAVDQS